MREKSGITLVSLVITIIILIILAGVSINTLVGDNGIITKAKQAKENITLASQTEAIALNQLYDELVSNGEIAEDEESHKKDEIISNLQKDLTDLQNKFLTLQTEFTQFRTTIAQAITNKGISTAYTDSAQVMAQNIQNIAGGDLSVYYANYNFSSNTTSVDFAVTKDTLYLLTNGNWFTSSYTSQLKLSVDATPLDYIDYSTFSNKEYLVKYDTKNLKGKTVTLYANRTNVVPNAYNIITVFGI
ncbi:MAG: hypothetical protein ACLTEH_04340 [Clostridia bacterium]